VQTVGVVGSGGLILSGTEVDAIWPELSGWPAYLRESISAHLGAPIAIDDRVTQAFAVTTRRGSRPNLTHVWAALAQSWPAVWRMYAALGHDGEYHPPLPRVLQRLDATSDSWLELEWDRTHRGVFGGGHGGTGSLTSAASEAVRSGRLGGDLLAASILEVENFSHLLQGRSPGGRRTSPVIRHLSRATGLGGQVRYTPEVASMRDAAVAILRSTVRLDAANGSQQFFLYQDEDRIRFRPYGVFGLHAPGAQRDPDDGPTARVNVVQQSGIFADDEIEEFEDLINSDARESVFQQFLEKHPHLLTSLGPYLRAHAHVAMTDDTGSRLIPDFFLERSDRALADICDLKRANVELVRRQKNRNRFSGAIQEAVAQLSHYRDFFEDRENRAKFRQAHPELDAFRPRVIIVVGRRSSFDDDLSRVKLESMLPGYVDLRTYDDILMAARKWQDFISRTAIRPS
jgi:hypothetical protein